MQAKAQEVKNSKDLISMMWKNHFESALISIWIRIQYFRSKRIRIHRVLMTKNCKILKLKKFPFQTKKCNLFNRRPPWRTFQNQNTHKTSSYIKSSYKTSRIQNVQDTKRPVTKRPDTERPGYKTSRTQNVQNTKRPVFVNLKTCLKIRGWRPDILHAVHALRLARSDVVITQLRGRDTMRCAVPAWYGPWVMRNRGDKEQGCVPTLCWDRLGLVVGSKWAGG
jgi:hypothetical protein